MKKVKNVKVGDVVKFPAYQFAPFRSGWNGWDFEVAIVKRIYTSAKGDLCAEIVYQKRLREYTEATKKIRCEFLFEYEYSVLKKNYENGGKKFPGFELLNANGLL